MNSMHALQTAFAHHQKGSYKAAETIYQKILKRYPDNFDALHMLGVLYFQQEQYAKAEMYLAKALHIHPDNPIVLYNLGNVFFRMGRFDDAIRSYRESLRLNPGFAETYYNLANALREESSLDDAIQYYQKALQLNPGHADAQYNLGNLLIQQKRLHEAVESYSKVIQINPRHEDAFLNRGFALQILGKAEEALESYYRLLQVNPRSLEAYNNLGNLLKDLGQLHDAEKCFKHAMDIDPAFPIPYSNLLFLMHYDPRFDAHSMYAEHRHFAKKFAEPLLSDVAVYGNDTSPDRKLRIGYVSPDFRRHSVAYFIEPVLAEHTREEYEIFCYSIVPPEDDVTERLKEYADTWRNISTIDDHQAADLIRQDEIDILVDLAGHTCNNRILIFARKPAPVLVSWIGYPATTGLSSIDYKLVDKYTDPPGMTEQYYTEKLIRIPGCFLCYLPDRESPEVSPLPSLSAGHITFGSFNNFAKVTPDMLDLWADILKAVPGAHLILKAKFFSARSVRENIINTFVQRGVPAERVELLAWQPSVREHLSLYGRIDIALDTFPYNGTTTTCEAMWMGVPVITLGGNTHASRVGVSILSNIGMFEFIAGSREEYKNIAIAYAQDMNTLKEIRGKLRDRMIKSVITDAKRFVPLLEMHYRKIWETWCST